jgi:DNA-dependent RNA polymerase
MTFQAFTGTQYLQIDIANSFGLDKLSWQARIDWFDQTVKPVINDDVAVHQLMQKADQPALLFAGVESYRNMLAGKPDGYPINLDATSSGIQLLSVLASDKKSASLCNVVDTGERQNAYMGLYKAMLTRLGDYGLIDPNDTTMLSADDCKQAIMTAFYSSKAQPRRIFGEGPVLDTFYETLAEEAPGAWEITEAMLSIWDNEAYENSWVMPDNFHVRVKVMDTIRDSVRFDGGVHEVSYSVNQPIANGRSLGANLVHSVDGMISREITRRATVDRTIISALAYESFERNHGGLNRKKDDDLLQLAYHYRASGFMSTRVFEFLDEHNGGIFSHDEQMVIKEIIDSMPPKPFNVLIVHDCFRVLPNNGNHIRKMYNRLLMEIARSNLLSFLMTQIVGRLITVTKLDPELHTEIMDANYALS